MSARSVTLNWSKVAIAGGPDATGYTVRRYNSSSVLQTIGTGCSGTITALTCTESPVPSGSWKYTVAAKYASWTGAESSLGTAVVESPQLSLSPASVSSSALPASLTGTIGNFIDGETARFRLDDPSTGTVLSGAVAGNATPTAVPAGGGATVQVTLPAGTSLGAHTIYAVASPSGENASAAVTVTSPPPDVTDVVVASHPNKGKGFTKQGGNYFVYANIAGTVTTATADVSSITAGATAVTMAACQSQCDVDGVTYGYRSSAPAQSVNGVLAQGSYAFAVTASNSSGSDSMSGVLTIDNSAPAFSPGKFVLNNEGGAGSEGLPVTGETIVVEFSEAIAVNTLCQSWTNNSANKTSDTLTVTFTDGGTGNGAVNDIMTFGGATCGAFNLDRVDFGVKNYLDGGGSMNFTNSAMFFDVGNKRLTITLGTLSGPSIASGNKSNLTSTLFPGSSTTAPRGFGDGIQDLAGNTISGLGTYTGRQF